MFLNDILQTAGSAQSSPSSIVSMDPDSSPGSPAKPSSASGSRDKRIRVSTSDGRQVSTIILLGLSVINTVAWVGIPADHQLEGRPDIHSSFETTGGKP